MTYTVEKIRKIITSGNTTMDNFLKSLTEQDRQDLLDLYKQEATYYYTQVAPQVIGKSICNDCLERINRLTIIYRFIVLNILEISVILNKLNNQMLIVIMYQKEMIYLINIEIDCLF